MARRLKMKKPATVQKIIVDPYTKKEKAEIAVHGADDLYREIRIDNTVEDESGHKARLKQGAEVDVTVEAEPQATIPKSE